MAKTTCLTIVSICLVLPCLDEVTAQASSSCQTMQFRSLTHALQNEYQCMLLEQLKQDFDEERQSLKRQYDNVFSMSRKFQETLLRSISGMTAPSRDSRKTIPSLRDVPLVRDCNELQQNGIKLSGVYPIRLPDRNIVNVWCDMDTSHGGWTTIQKRVDGSIDFERSWDDYAFGFGNPNSEYWIGNENIYRMTNNKKFSVRFDMWDWEGNHAHAFYEAFRVESEYFQYELKISGYSGTSGDAMSQYHDGMKFSTLDSDNDEWNLSCATKDKSGWWFRACGYASPNGQYVPSGKAEMDPDGIIRGITWYNWKQDFTYSMKRMEIKIKPWVSVKYDIEQDKLNVGAVSGIGEAESGTESNGPNVEGSKITSTPPTITLTTTPMTKPTVTTTTIPSSTTTTSKSTTSTSKHTTTKVKPAAAPATLTTIPSTKTTTPNSLTKSATTSTTHNPLQTTSTSKTTATLRPTTTPTTKSTTEWTTEYYVDEDKFVFDEFSY